MIDPSFLTAILAFTLIVISPGPAVLAILAAGLSEGRAKALSLTAGVLTGSSIWAVAALIGLVGLLETLGDALIWLKIASGLYLIYLGSKALRGALSDDAPAAMRIGARDTLGGYFLAGLLIHLTNPKAVFGWVATMSLGLKPGATTGEAAVLTAACLAVVISLKLLMALVFSTQGLRKAYLRARRAIMFAFAGFFTFAGLRMILSR